MYDWDSQKDKANQEKHGISFAEAKESIFEGKNMIALDVAYDLDEPRHAIIGKHRGNYYTGIFTIRNNRIRIISVRRARRNEEKQAKQKGI